MLTHQDIYQEKLERKIRKLERENAELHSSLRDMICYYNYKIRAHKENKLLERAEALVVKGGSWK